MKRALLVVGALLALVLIAGPFVTGMIAEGRLKSLVPVANRDLAGAEVLLEQYERGWFASTGRVRLQINNKRFLQWARELTEDADLVRLPTAVIETSISHGPLGTGSGGPVSGGVPLAVATAVVTLELDDTHRYRLPGHLYFKVDFSGDVGVAYVADAVTHVFQRASYAPINVDWQGASLRVSVDSGNESIEVDGVFGALKIDTTPGVSPLPLMDLDFGPMTVEIDARHTPFEGIYEGKTRLTIDRFAADFGYGSPGFSGFSYTATSVLEENDLFADVELTVESFRDADTEHPVLESRISLENFDAASTGALLRLLRKSWQELAVDGDPAAVLADGEKAFRDLLLGAPRLYVERLNLNLAGGTVAMTVDILVPDLDDRDAGMTVDRLLRFINARATVRAPAAVVESDPWLGQDLAAAVNGLLQYGLLREQNDSYVMDTVFQNGVLSLNGVPVPVPVEF